MLITINIEPFAKQRNWTHQGRIIKNKKSRLWEKEAAVLLRQEFLHSPFYGAIDVNICFLFERPKTVKRKFHTVRPDIDNLQKSILDAANGILWNDDSQIVHLNSSKLYAQESKIEIKILGVLS